MVSELHNKKLDEGEA